MKLKILGIRLEKLCAYFIIYSFIGYVIETLFAIITMSVWQSRQSFLYGPFLGIYGLGAVIILLFAQYFKKNNYTLFLGGYFIGTITEYLTSFGVELLLNTHWWDYSNNFLNLNGRVCLLYSFFWGILTILLIKVINPIVDQFLRYLSNKLTPKILSIIIAVITIFLIIDCILTCIAQDAFVTRMVVRHRIEVDRVEEYQEKYDKIYSNEILSKIINTLWDDEKMIKTFPNMKIQDKNNNTIYFDQLLPDIEPYYRKIKGFEKR